MCATLTTASVARAENKDLARRAYDEGRRRYDLNEFAAALDAFKRAYLNYEDPAFLFNIAQCHRQLGQKQEAIRFYRSYLRNKADAPNREEVKATVSRLETEVADENARVADERRQAAARIATQPSPAAAATVPATATTATTLTTAPPARQPVYKKWWLWTIVGVAAAGAATGLALGLTSQKTEPSLMTVTVSR